MKKSSFVLCCASILVSSAIGSARCHIPIFIEMAQYRTLPSNRKMSMNMLLRLQVIPPNFELIEDVAI